MDDFASHRQQIEKEIVVAVAMGLETGRLREEDLHPIGTFVLGRIDVIKNEHELASFLSELATKWNIFSSISIIEKGHLKGMEDKEVVSSILNLMSSGKIDRAVSLMQNQKN